MREAGTEAGLLALEWRTQQEDERRCGGFEGARSWRGPQSSHPLRGTQTAPATAISTIPAHRLAILSALGRANRNGDSTSQYVNQASSALKPRISSRSTSVSGPNLMIPKNTSSG